MPRRTRLPLVVSLFLAALLGSPTTAGPATAGPATGPLPVPVAAATAANPAAAPAPAPALDETGTPPPAGGGVPAQPVLLPTPALTDQVSRAATAPRGPPHTA